MRLRSTMVGVLAAVLAGAAAYAASVATRSGGEVAPAADAATQALMDWLEVPASQQAGIREEDPGFAEDLRALRGRVAARRVELAGALDDAEATDEAIREKLEALIAANAELERRVVAYLLSVRQHLTTEQQRRLFGLCADGIRHGPDGIGRGQGGMGRGLGPPAGRGPGQGGGFRGGRGQD